MKTIYCPLCKVKHRIPLKGQELSQHRINIMNQPLELVQQWLIAVMNK